jgi:hypothetical protein
LINSSNYSRCAVAVQVVDQDVVDQADQEDLPRMGDQAAAEIRHADHSGLNR